jgi:hypothetical protein
VRHEEQSKALSNAFLFALQQPVLTVFLQERARSGRSWPNSTNFRQVPDSSIPELPTAKTMQYSQLEPSGKEGKREAANEEGRDADGDRDLARLSLPERNWVGPR